MKTNNPLESREQFTVQESDMAYFHNRPRRIAFGAIMMCQAGEAEVTTDLQSWPVERNTQIILLPGMILMFSKVSPDFRIRFFAFSHELFEEASYRMDIEFFHFMREHPVHHHEPKTARAMNLWLELSSYVYEDKGHLFRNTVLRNRLQNALLEIYDKVQRSGVAREEYTQPNRQVKIFRKFINLVHTHSVERRDVAFYADKLCVSPRYLSAITRNVANASVKEIIDRMVLLEIRMLLQSTDLSIQEIADRLSFPDQSYLGRYFKKHTGESPSVYRSGNS